jgi:ribosomal protein L2
MAPDAHLVERIEYDPNRSAHLALIEHPTTKIKSYIIAAEGMRAGDMVESFRSGIPEALLQSMGGVIDPGILAAKTCFRGNCLPLRLIPVGTQVYNVGTRVAGGGVFCRSAGTFATVVGKGDRSTGFQVILRLQSGEVRKFDKDACATVGVVSNPNHHFRQLGKAGRSRWLNIRPTVRGVAMNAVDHPHGGGRGKSKGNVHPVSVWGTPVSHDFLEKTIEFVLTNQYRPKEASRREGSGTRTSTLSLNGPGTTASVGPQRDDCTRRSVEMRIDAGNLYYAG